MGGTEHHVTADGAGPPLNATVTQFVSLVAGTKLVVPAPGGADLLPARVLGDRAYRSAGYHAVLRWLGTEPVVARPGSPHGSGLRVEQYVVERTIANPHQNRRLKVRYEERPDTHKEFLTLARVKNLRYRLLALK